jgi:hypothetical protein
MFWIIWPVLPGLLQMWWDLQDKGIERGRRIRKTLMVQAMLITLFRSRRAVQHMCTGIPQGLTFQEVLS